jgi:hypothetical protein
MPTETPTPSGMEKRDAGRTVVPIEQASVVTEAASPLAEPAQIPDEEPHETTEEAVRHTLEARRTAELDAIITHSAARTVAIPKKHHGLPYRIVHSRPFKAAAAAVAAVGIVGALQQLPRFETKPTSTPSGEVNPGQIGSVSKAIIPSASQTPESVPLTEITKTNGVLKIDKKTQDTFCVIDATIIEITTNPDNQDEIWLKVKLPGDTLTKTTPSTGDWIDYTGLTVDIRVNQYTYYNVGGNAETIVSLSKPVFKVGDSITALGAIMPNATGYTQTEADNAIDQTTLNSINANVGTPNNINSGYKLVALSTSS